MTLDQLRIFVAVADLQHMTRAADALNLAQSAVSHAIAALEARHATRLFDRIGRRIRLTEAGAALLIEARAILAQVAHAETVLGEYGSLLRGTLSVQASQTIASYWLPRHLVDFHRAHPQIAIQMTIGNSAQVAAAIETGAADLGFVEDEVAHPLLISQPVARDQLILVVGPDHHWAGKDNLGAKDLMDSDWVLRERGSGTRAMFEAALQALGVAAESLPVALELPANEAVRAAVEAGLGATAISASVAAAGIESGRLRHVPFRLPPREFRVLRQAGRSSSRAADALLATIGPAARKAGGRN